MQYRRSNLHGEPVRVNVANPGAQTNWSYTLPANYTYRVDSVCFKLVTDANPGNRIARVQLTDAADNILAEPMRGSNIAASLTLRATFGPGCTSEGAIGMDINAGLNDMILKPGEKIKSAVLWMMAADAITEIYISMQRWPTFGKT